MITDRDLMMLVCGAVWGMILVTAVLMARKGLQR
jgi:hypothetical protein